jgi:hypothetical protein
MLPGPADASLPSLLHRLQAPLARRHDGSTFREPDLPALSGSRAARARRLLLRSGKRGVREARDGIPAPALGRLATDLEHLLPSPTELEIDHAFNEVVGRLGLGSELSAVPGKRVALRMVVTIASTLSQPVIRESGVMRLPQTIRGLFDVTGKPQPVADGRGSKGEA